MAEWVNVETVGTAPIRRTYAFKSWRLDMWYYVDAKGNMHVFSPAYVLRLGCIKKEFDSLEELNKYLASKGLPQLK